MGPRLPAAPAAVALRAHVDRRSRALRAQVDLSGCRNRVVGGAHQLINAQPMGDRVQALASITRALALEYGNLAPNRLRHHRTARCMNVLWSGGLVTGRFSFPTLSFPFHFVVFKFVMTFLLSMSHEC